MSRIPGLIVQVSMAWRPKRAVSPSITAEPRHRQDLFAVQPVNEKQRFLSLKMGAGALSGNFLTFVLSGDGGVVGLHFLNQPLGQSPEIIPILKEHLGVSEIRDNDAATSKYHCAWSTRSSERIPKSLKSTSPVGFEPTTIRLTGECFSRRRPGRGIKKRRFRSLATKW
jgi:hypothetical protein